MELQTWFINVFAGSAAYFTPIAIFLILVMAGYFRMSGLTMGFMILMFLIMFAGYVSPSFLLFVAMIGGLLVGWYITKIVKN